MNISGLRQIGLFLLLLALLLSGCAGEEAEGAALTFVWGGTYEYGAGTTLPGDVLMIDGRLQLAEGARVAGALYMLGGTLESQGSVGGDVVILGGQASFAESARVAGSLDFANGLEVTVAPGVVQGRQTERIAGIGPDALAPEDETGFDDLLRALFSAVLLGLATAWIAGRRPMLLARVAEAATRHPLVGGAVGLLAAAVTPALLVLMAFTVVLLPVTTLGIVLMLLVSSYAQAALGWALGQRFAAWWGWRPQRATFAGVVILLMGLWLLRLVPIVGDVLFLIVVVVAVGAVLLTRFGTAAYQPPQPRVEADLSSYRRPGKQG
ncbi:MAG: hypothetical protein RRC07_16830 [Anaerolineae bacterium]|nr:hypothetical protein [Anaerolineae bacterium]